MWACSEPLRQPRLRCTISQTLVFRRGPWSKPRSGWRLEARPLTTFPNLRVIRNSSSSLTMHSFPTPVQHNLKHTFVSSTAITLRTRNQGTRTRTRYVMFTMIHEVTPYVGRPERVLLQGPGQEIKHQQSMRGEGNVATTGRETPLKNWKASIHFDLLRCLCTL